MPPTPFQGVPPSRIDSLPHLLLPGVAMSLSRPAELLAFLQEHSFLTLSQSQQLSGGFADDRALARELVGRHWLTAYQASQLLQGKGAELLLGPYRLLDRLGEGGMGQSSRLATSAWIASSPSR